MADTMTDTKAYLDSRRETMTRVKALLAEMKSGASGSTFDPAWIADDEPLFGRGLELDSLDVATLAIGLSQLFDVLLTDEDIDAMGSVNRLVDFIRERQQVGVS